MPKITLYLDMYPGMDLSKYVTAISTPGDKLVGSTRVAIPVDLPDINEPDVLLDEVNAIDEEKDNVKKD